LDSTHPYTTVVAIFIYPDLSLIGICRLHYPVYQWSSIYSCSLHARSLSLVKACDSALNPYSGAVLVPLTVIFFMLPQNQALRSECLCKLTIPLLYLACREVFPPSITAAKFGVSGCCARGTKLGSPKPRLTPAWTSDLSYRGEACQPLDLEVKGHFRIRKVQPGVWCRK
jgi:hypothetical protein